VILETFLNEYRPGWSRTEFDVDALALKKNDAYLEMAKTQLGANWNRRWRPSKTQATGFVFRVEWGRLTRSSKD
jgi:hypothetical protein